jgi:hypothetical protein
MKVPLVVPNVTELNKPLNPGYLPSSLPPKINLTNLVVA